MPECKLATTCLLTKVANQVLDILEANGVQLAGGGITGPHLRKDGRTLYLHDVDRDRGQGCNTCKVSK